MLIHCAQGKDRTGVLAALLQHAAGDLEREIIEGYAASEALLAERPRDEAAEPRESEGGVDWSALRGSPPEAMVETLQWLRSTYGAIDSFLEGTGCGNEWREVLLAPPALHGRGWR